MPQPSSPSVARLLSAAAQRPSARIVRMPMLLRQDPRESETSVTAVNTSLLTLTPAFLDAIKKVAPKKRRSKVPYVIALALLAVLAVLGCDVSAREFGIAKGRQIASRLHRAPAGHSMQAPVVASVAQAVIPVAVPAASAAAPVVQAAAPAPVVEPAVVTLAVTKRSAKSPAVRSKKAQPRPAVRPST